MTREQIIKQVLVKLDEITVFDDAQQIPTVGMVDALINESTVNMLRNAPMHMLSPDKVSVISLEPYHYKFVADGWGYIGLPTNFLRLYSFKMLLWERAVSSAISQTNPKYNQQKNKFTRGGVSKPVAVINHLTELNQSIVFD